MSDCVFVSEKEIFLRNEKRTVHRDVYCSFFSCLQAWMLHYASQILTSVERRQEVHRAKRQYQTVVLLLGLRQTIDAAVGVSDMPGYRCCRRGAVRRAAHLCVLVTASPLSAGVDGDVRASCAGKE